MADVSKLPKWARAHIVMLERQVEILENTLSARNGEAVGGRVKINPYSPSRLLFSDDTTVRFSLSESEYRDYFDVRLVPGGIRVRSADGMVIEPEVTNSITLKIAG